MRGPVFAGAMLLIGAVAARGGDDRPALRLVVMDPLCRELTCDCVKGYAQRDYGRLASFLATELGRDIVACAESLASPEAGAPHAVDLIAGKFSTVVSDAALAKIVVRPLAMLTSAEGQTTLTGLFVVRKDDPAKSIADLAGRRVLFGPPESDEKRSAAFAALEAFGVPIPAEPSASEGCTTAAMAVVEGASDAAVISSYAMPLLKGCGTIAEGELRVIGRTDPVPFIGIFATGRVSASLDSALRAALLRVATDKSLLDAMESGEGFVPLDAAIGGEGAPGWGDWRGAARDGVSRDVPATLPARPRLLWSRTMTGPGMSGLAVSGGRLIVADKGARDTTDIFRCLDADTGREIWKLAYRAEGNMDFTNSPRATPVVRDGLVYTLGAFGHIHCLRLDTGEIVWRRNIVADFGAELPAWGTSATPLVVDDHLIVNPGAKDASLAALDRHTGAILWKSPGERAAYASFVLAAFDGVRQIVGYDGISLGGWDPGTGRRLWRLAPESEGDFNVPTPVVVGNRLLVATENNGTRLFGFNGRGAIDPKPIATNDTLSPDTSTPVVVAGRVLGSCGSLVCLDVEGGLRTIWEEAEAGGLGEYCSFIAGSRHALVAGVRGRLLLLEASRERFDPVARLDLFPDVPDTERDVWSHPALVGDRLYVRNLLGVYCFSMADCGRLTIR